MAFQVQSACAVRVMAADTPAMDTGGGSEAGSQVFEAANPQGSPAHAESEDPGGQVAILYNECMVTY